MPRNSSPSKNSLNLDYSKREGCLSGLMPLLQVNRPRKDFYFMQIDSPDQTWTYDEIAAKADSVRSLLTKRGIKLNDASALGIVLREADRLAADWSHGRSTGGVRRLINAAHANRICEAILAAQDDVGALECIKRMAKSGLDLSRREISQGKDALWEIELASSLKRRGIEVSHEEPDLVAAFGFGPCPIACKKVYSEKNFEVQISKGAQQVANTGVAGLVAVNLDDLVPDDALLQSATKASAAEFLNTFNRAFINRHQTKIQRFIKDKRCIGFLISTTTLVDIVDSSPRLNTNTQTMLWTLSPLRYEQDDRVSKIMRAMGEVA
jgi:hypothetical protein